MKPWSAFLAIGVITLQMILISSLLTLRARQRRAEVLLRANEATLKASYMRIRRLAGRLIDSREAIRARIARDLHDDVCQQLAGLSVAISDLKHRVWDIQHPPAQEALAALQCRTCALVESVRHLSHDLHPSTLEHIGIAAALEGLCVEIEQRYDVQVSFATKGDLTSISTAAELCLFRIAQEALHNAAVHGNARRASLFIANPNKDIQLTIRDDGNGFDLDVTRHNGIGLGLESMVERAHMLGGELDILTKPSQGTTIYVRIPPTVSVDGHKEVEELS